MSNDSAPVGGAHGFDSDALEEWVTETARQKGVSKQKLLDEILSSYWVLEELSGVVSDSSVSHDSPTADDQRSVDPADHQEPATQPPAGDTQPSANEFTELKSELQDLRGAIEELSGETQPSDEEPTATEVSTLEGQLDDLSTAVVDRQSETDSSVKALTDQLETVEDRLATLETQLDSGLSLAELRETVRDTERNHSELESRLESEFDSIEKVLQHLLDTTDNIEYRLGAVSDSRKEALKPLQARNAMQDALADLKQEAIRHGIRTGVCDSCEQSIDLGLLERPECPSCERRFTGISKGGWLPFSKPQLKTTDRPHEPHSQGQSQWTPTDRQHGQSGGGDGRTNW